MNERSVVRLITYLAYQASTLLAKLFDIRNEDILINLPIILTSRESERNCNQCSRSKLTLRHIAQHGGSILVLVLATHLLQHDVALHHLAVLALLALHGESLALLHHSHNLSIHIIK